METITNRLKPKAGPSPIVSPTGRAEPSHAQSRDEQLEGLAALPYHTRMSHFVRGSTRHRVAGDITVLDFRPLYTVAVHDLQRRLATEIQKIGKSDVTDQQLEDIGDTLHKYSEFRLPRYKTQRQHEKKKETYQAPSSIYLTHSQRPPRL